MPLKSANRYLALPLAFHVPVFLFCMGGALFCINAANAQVTLPSHAKQGETIEIELRTERRLDPADSQSDNQSIKALFNAHAVPLFPTKGKDGVRFLQGLLTMPADLNPGTYCLELGQEEHEIKVEDGKFPIQRINLPKAKDNFVMSYGEKEAIEGAKAVTSATRLWQGEFTKPCQSPQSACFGMKRMVNGRLLKDYFHSGLDFAAPTGKPVLACACGRVILAKTGFKLHGNTVAIDHGQGVVSFYIHLSRILVKEGEMVESGQQIGAVGQTGRANGPHLHFSIYVNQTASNPSQWFTTGF